MRSHKFLAGAVTGIALLLLVSVLLLTQLGRQPASAASGTPETKSTASAAASPSAPNDQLKTSVANDPVSRMVTPVSDAEWSAAAATLGMTESDFQAAIEGGKSVADLGAPHNVTAVQVRAAMVAAGTAAVHAAVQNGTITQADADAVTSGIVTAIADKVTQVNTGTVSAAGTPTANDQALEAQKRAMASQPDNGSNVVANAEISAMASTLGISADDLKTALSNPSNIATLAAAHNVTAQQLQDAMVAAGQQALNQAVANGTISQADADALRTGQVQQMAAKLSSMANAPGAATP